MEEVDKIILHTLRQIGCDIEDEVTSLSSFDSNMIVNAAVNCLEIIQPGLALPKSLPPNMATKYRVGQEIAQACMDQGYPGEIGYQTFLYSGESDIRKILMFLVEKLPKEEEKFVREPSGSELLLSRIKCKVKEEASRPWLPFNSCSFEWTSEFKPYTDSNLSPALAWRRFWRNDLPLGEISDCQLLPTILMVNSVGVTSKYEPKSFTLKRPKTTSEVSKSVSKYSKDSISSKRKPPLPPKPNLQNIDGVNQKELAGNDETISNELLIEKEINSIQVTIEKLKMKNEQLEKEVLSEQQELQQVKEMNSIKAKVLELMPSGDNGVQKLQENIEESSKKLVIIAKQWEKHRQLLVSKYRECVSLCSNRQNESVKKAETARSLNERRKEMETELKNKERLLEQLQIESERVGREANRSAYTRRILEIIGNIDKQKLEISKVLKDTQQVQKEINTLTGQLGRSFIMADETIFADAKKDETSRKAYKLLATLHSDCDQLVAMVQETGTILRDIRDLEDQIEKERSKDVAANLERITADLNQMKQESAHLAAQLKAKQGNTALS